MQRGKSLTRALAKRREEARQRRLARHRLDAEHLRERRILPQVGDARKLVRPAQDAAQEAQRHIRRIVGMVALRRMRQHLRQLCAKRALVQKLRPHHHSAMRRQPLVGKRNPHRLRPVCRANFHLHRLVRLRSRLRDFSFSIHTSTPPNGAPLFN